MEKTICELFAGVGGFRLGFERASKEWETVWFSQWEPGKTKQWAHDCYVNHFGDLRNDTGIDISLVDKKTIPTHNLLVGGFPCQDYSVAHSLNGEKGIEGKKGILWWQIRDTLIEKNTPFILLENVDRLLKSPSKQRGRDFGIILSCLNELDYSVEWRVINASEYGAQQRRKRTYIFAYKNKTNFGRKQSCNNVSDIIYKTGFFAHIFEIEQLHNDNIKTNTFETKELSDISDSFSFPFENSGYMSKGMIYTVKTFPIQQNPIPLINILEKKVSQKYYITDDKLQKWKYLKGSKKIERTSNTGYKYIFSEGAVAFPDDINMPARTMLTSESTINRSSHVIEDLETKKLRIITPLEAERIQGFDDNWTNTGMPERMRYFCMGNALVVPLITKMAIEIGKIFNNE